jgi:hypothetical protein
MTINVPGCARLLLLTGVLVLMPLQVSSSGISYHVAWANNAGGNGNGKGQGQSRAGSNVGSGSAALAGAGGSAGAASNRGRFNSLNASVNAFGHASLKSSKGALTQYSAALTAFETIDATDDPTAEELAAILAKVANKDELTAETIDWIHQLLLSKGLVTQTTLDDAASILAPPIDPNTDPTAVATPAPTLAELLAEQASLIQESEPNQGLGPIY